VRACASQGIWLERRAFERGISVVTAPARERSGSIVAAVTVTVPRSEFGTAREKDDLVTRRVRRGDRTIDANGYRPYDGDPTAQLAAREPKKRSERAASRRCAKPLGGSLRTRDESGEHRHLIAVTRYTAVNSAAFAPELARSYNAFTYTCVIFDSR